MIGYYVNRWLIFFWLHGLLNRLTGGRMLRWAFSNAESVLTVRLRVDWGHTDEEVWRWHREYAVPIATSTVNFPVGWRMTECPREIDPAYNSAGDVLSADPSPPTTTPPE